MSYTFEDIKRAYAAVGVEEGRVVLVKTDLRYLGPFEDPRRSAILAAHFRALAELVNLDKGTIVVGADSASLCNTDTPFDPANSPSELGVFTEYVRQQDNAFRTYHPFISHAAIGADAETICSNVSRHAYGLGTAKAKMLELDALYLSVGREPGWTCSFVHHMEMLMGVPYRYTKEFKHPMVQPDGSISKELFYMFVCYRGLNLQRNRNKKFFKRFGELGYELRETGLGLGSVWGYSCREFCSAAESYLKDDIYGWLDTPPEERPYRV